VAYDSTMQVTVRLFAVLRERAGIEQLALKLDSQSSVANALQQIGEQLPELRPILGRVATAVNRSYVKPDATLHDGDELALIPPVSGG
jgi:molybdopterin converting factor subunit 1